MRFVIRLFAIYSLKNSFVPFRRFNDVIIYIEHLSDNALLDLILQQIVLQFQEFLVVLELGLVEPSQLLLGVKVEDLKVDVLEFVVVIQR